VMTSRTAERSARPGQLDRQESRSISSFPRLNLGGQEIVDALLHGQARKAWLEVRGDERG
jgi:hypothetical protein